MSDRPVRFTQPNRFAEAYALQDACNLSGVAHTLLDMIRDIRENENGDTRTVANDPAVILTVHKLLDLCPAAFGADLRFDGAWDRCRTAHRQAADARLRERSGE